MYHNISNIEQVSSGLTISVQKLERQLCHLVESGFTTFHLSELENLTAIPQLCFVFNFVDVTDFLCFYAVPLPSAPLFIP
jgi:hypothetical protein